LTTNKEELESALAKGEGSAEDFAAWGKTLNELTQQLEDLEMRWLELSELQ
jgi:hypothetical protein